MDILCVVFFFFVCVKNSNTLFAKTKWIKNKLQTNIVRAILQ